MAAQFVHGSTASEEEEEEKEEVQICLPHTVVVSVQVSSCSHMAQVVLCFTPGLAVVFGTWGTPHCCRCYRLLPSACGEGLDGLQQIHTCIAL